MIRKPRQKFFVCYVNFLPLVYFSHRLCCASVTHWELGMTNGALFGVPIPQRYEAVGEILQEAVEKALIEAEQNGMNKRGKEATPWLLRRVGELTNGESLTSSQWQHNSNLLTS
jgi:pseudouridine-5'-phosphate glycosidase